MQCLKKCFLTSETIDCCYADFIYFYYCYLFVRCDLRKSTLMIFLHYKRTSRIKRHTKSNGTILEYKKSETEEENTQKHIV